MQVPLSNPADAHGFHTEALRLLAQQVPPDDVRWSAPPAASVTEEQPHGSRRVIGNRAARAIVPQSFVRMSELVVLHRDPQRFDFLYRLLWRLVHDPDLRGDAGDGDLARLRQMAQAVRRDIHKMKSRLAFEPVMLKGQAVEVAWYEPVHFVSEVVAGWLATRKPPPWLVCTPDRCVRWDGQRLLCAPGVPAAAQPRGQPLAEWARGLDALPWA